MNDRRPRQDQKRKPTDVDAPDSGNPPNTPGRGNPSNDPSRRDQDRDESYVVKNHLTSGPAA